MNNWNINRNSSIIYSKKETKEDDIGVERIDCYEYQDIAYVTLETYRYNSTGKKG